MKNKPIPIDKLYTKYLIEEVELQSWTLIICTFTISTGFCTTSEVEAFIYINHKPIDFSIDFSCRLKA